MASQAYSNQRILAKYEAWDKANPTFYPMFVRYTFQLAARGHKSVSAKLIFERIRWETMLQTVGEDRKLNNNYTAIYARRFMTDHPQFGTMFKVRETSS